MNKQPPLAHWSTNLLCVVICFSVIHLASTAKGGCADHEVPKAQIDRPLKTYYNQLKKTLRIVSNHVEGSAKDAIINMQETLKSLQTDVKGHLKRREKCMRDAQQMLQDAELLTEFKYELKQIQSEFKKGGDVNEAISAPVTAYVALAAHALKDSILQHTQQIAMIATTYQLNGINHAKLRHADWQTISELMPGQLKCSITKWDLETEYCSAHFWDTTDGDATEISTKLFHLHQQEQDSVWGDLIDDERRKFNKKHLDPTTSFSARELAEYHNCFEMDDYDRESLRQCRCSLETGSRTQVYDKCLGFFTDVYLRKMQEQVFGNPNATDYGSYSLEDMTDFNSGFTCDSIFSDTARNVTRFKSRFNCFDRIERKWPNPADRDAIRVHQLDLPVQYGDADLKMLAACKSSPNEEIWESSSLLAIADCILCITE